MSVYFAAGALALVVDRTIQLTNFEISKCQFALVLACFVFAMTAQIFLRLRLVSDKGRKGF